MDDSGHLERALGFAYRHLGRRDRTVAEVLAHLERRGVEPETAEAAVAELREQGYLDDGRFARRFTEDRRTLDGWGAERIERSLLSSGVAPELIEEALADRSTGDERDAAVALLRSRFARPPADDRERQRALGLLVRRGYDSETAYDAVRALSHDSGD